MPGTLRVERDGFVARLTLAHPAKKNALDPPLLGAIADAIPALAKDGVRAAVLTAEGPIFSSGYDLAALANEARPGAALHAAVSAILDGPLPLVAALPGLAIGGGCELACACDLRVAHAGVALQMPPVRLGLVYPPEGLRRFVALIGMSRTRELFLTARRVPAELALAWGLVDRVVDEAAVLSTAHELAAQIAEGAPSAVRGTRRVLAALDPPLQKEIADELERIVREAASGPDAIEARAAFAARRRPSFT